MNSGRLSVGRHKTCKPKVADRASGPFKVIPDAWITARKSVVAELNHRHAIDVHRKDFSHHTGLYHISILVPVLRTFRLFQHGELSQRPLPPGDIAVGLRNFEAAKHDFTPRAIVRRNGTPQA